MGTQVSFETKEHVIDTFVTAGIAFYLKGNWRGIFAKCKIPEYRKWKNREREDMEKLFNNFFEVHK
jgi:hypothetical protein